MSGAELLTIVILTNRRVICNMFHLFKISNHCFLFGIGKAISAGTVLETDAVGEDGAGGNDDNLKVA